MPVPGVDLEAYKKEVITRCANTDLRDPLSRTTTEGPLPNVLDIVRDLLAMDKDQTAGIEVYALAVAAWMRRCRVDENEMGKPVTFIHPLADVLNLKAREAGNAPTALFSITGIFGELGQNKQFVDAVSKYLVLLDQKDGVEISARHVLDQCNEFGQRKSAECTLRSNKSPKDPNQFALR